jgi:hypothetical protein
MTLVIIDDYTTEYEIWGLSRIFDKYFIIIELKE